MKLPNKLIAFAFKILAVQGLFWTLLASSSWALDFAAVVGPHQEPAVVALAYKNADDSLKIFCTAVAIHQRVVLTAAHCLQGGHIRESSSANRRAAKELFVYSGPGFDDGTIHKAFGQRNNISDIFQNVIFPVDNFFIHADYLRSYRGQADIAVVVLKSPMPLSDSQLAPLGLDIPTLKLELRQGSRVEAVGYGWSKTQVEGSRFLKQEFGIKKTAKLSVSEKTGTEIMISPGEAIDRMGLHRPKAREGDSGGPLFFTNSQGKKKLVGLVSRSTSLRKQNVVVAYSLIRPYICWIQSVSGLNYFSSQNEVDYCGPDFRKKVGRHAPISFIEACQNPKSLPLADQYTLKVIKDLYQKPQYDSPSHSPSNSQCSDLQQKLGSSLVINLDMTYINSTRILNEFQQLERLSLRDNLLDDLALKGFSQLRHLDVSYNNLKLPYEVPFGHQNLRLIGTDRQYWNFGRTHFIRLCGKPNNEPETQKTIDYILEHLDLRKEDCVNANYELARARELRLSTLGEIKDLNPLVGLVALEKLDISGHKVPSLDFVRGLPGLTQMVLDQNPVVDFSPLYFLNNLRYLSLRQMDLREIGFVAYLPRLQFLDISYNAIEDFSPVKDRHIRGLLELVGADTQKNLQNTK